MITKKQVIALLIVLFTPLISFSVTNGEIADKALEYDGITFGTWQEGQCKTFVQNVVKWAGGPVIGAGYKACYEAVGREINSSEAVRGDIIQVSSDTDPETDTSKVHTAIVLQNYGNGNYQVIDSNFVASLKVGIHNWSPLISASPGFSAHFYRLGSIVALYSDSSLNQPILNYYTANGGESVFGHPFDNNSGTAFVHRWPEQGTDYVVIQDFAGGIYGTDKQCAIIYNPNVNSAFLLKEGFFIS